MNPGPHCLFVIVVASFPFSEVLILSCFDLASGTERRDTVTFCQSPEKAARAKDGQVTDTCCSDSLLQQSNRRPETWSAQAEFLNACVVM